ncbi:MAG TPA: flagellar basal-body rod protein FlgG [Gemmataceae bacterium]|nr:flagellar basal-body rod protein FlgG [Gemmataceae bacterium]
MIEAITTSNTGLDASQNQLDTSSNNLANLNTTGFKANRVLFQDLLYTTLNAPSATNPAGTQLGRGVKLSSTDKLFGEGPLQNTGTQTDVAIDGSGFFVVKLPDGSTAYTRAGNFVVNSNGQLVTSDGNFLQPPITVPTNFTAISIATDGTVSVTVPGSSTFQKVGQITLARFANPPGLVSVGNTLFAPSPASGSAVITTPGQTGTGLLRQGFLEGSNVDATTELANLLVAQQTFVANSQAIITANDMLLTTAELVSLT